MEFGAKYVRLCLSNSYLKFLLKCNILTRTYSYYEDEFLQTKHLYKNHLGQEAKHYCAPLQSLPTTRETTVHAFNSLDLFLYFILYKAVHFLLLCMLSFAQ